MLKLWPYAKKYQVLIILGSIFKLLEAITELLLPIYMAQLVDEGIQKHNWAAIKLIGGKMILAILIGLGFVLICQYFASLASQGFGTELRKELLKKINALSYEQLNHFSKDTLITRLTSDINQLQYALAMLIRLVSRAPFLSIGSIVMAFLIQPKVALLFLFILPLFALLLLLIMRKNVPLYQKVQKKLDQLSRLISENLSGIRVIRAFARQKDRDQENIKTIDDLAIAYTRVANSAALIPPLTTFILNLGIIAVLYYGGYQVNSDSLQAGQILALINYMTQMLSALIIVANLVVTFTRAQAAGQRVHEVLDLPIIKPAGDQPFEPEKIALNQPILTFNQVDFQYPSSSGYALKDIHFTLNKGETLGIIGPTGSGKSTLLQLIPRFYEISSGQLLFGTQDGQQVDLASLQKAVAIVPQTNVLFTGTIRENLQWGKNDATDEECLEALKLAQCLDFVMQLEGKLNAPVQAGGANFSGGQRQRLAIARALIRKPALLLLDDALSALDYQTDLALRQALTNALPETTKIIVSQRISSVQQADYILVLVDGKQAALGTHEELLLNSTVYQELFALQQSVGGK